MSEPKISIVVPVYNIEQYLESAINSLINQTYKNLEILLVDDGSTDSSPNICDEYAKRDNRIRVFHQKNSGVSCARNLGIDMATGEYIGFCDGDDTVDCDMYEFLYNGIKNNNADISMCDVRFVFENNNIKEIATGKETLWNCAKDFSVDFCKNNIRIGVYTKLFKSEICKATKFNETLKINEDRLFCYETALKANQIYLNDVAKYSYYRRTNSSSTTCFTEKFNDIITVADMIYDLSEKHFPNSTAYAMAQKVTFYLRYYKLAYLRHSIGKFADKEKYIIETLKKYNSQKGKKYYNKNDKLRLKLLVTNKNLFYLLTKYFDKF